MKINNRRIHRGIKREKTDFAQRKTIKIVGYSHGAAHATEMANFLIKKGYEDERFDAVAPRSVKALP